MPSMIQRSPSKGHGHDNTPHAVCFSKKQMGEYLTDLRNNRPVRPNGSRPLPSSPAVRTNTSMESHAAGPRSSLPSVPREHSWSRSSSALSNRRDSHTVSGRSSPDKMYQQMSLRDRDQRQKERDEAHIVRLALEGMDLEEERRIVSAAHEEAAELLRQHQNPTVPSLVRESPSKPRQADGLYSPAKTYQAVSTQDDNFYAVKEPVDAHTEPPKRSLSRKLSNRLSLGRLVKRRSISGGGLRNVSGGARQFPNSTEKIWEDGQRSPERSRSPEKTTVEPSSRRNPFARAQSTRKNILPSPEKPTPARKPYEAREVQRNAPSQSHDPVYVCNDKSKSVRRQDAGHTPPMSSPEAASNSLRYRDGIEVRGDDIREATSMRRKDRSPKLPAPTVVSDRPGRPIVSFRHDWKSSEETTSGRFSDDQMISGVPLQTSPAENKPSSSSIAGSAVHPQMQDHDMNDRNQRPMQIPQINLPGEDMQETPVVSIEGTPLNSLGPTSEVCSPCPSRTSRVSRSSQTSSVEIPSISIDTPNESTAPGRQQRSTQGGSRNAAPLDGRPSERIAPAAPAAPTGSKMPHVTRYARKASALCAQCALPICGRIVTAAGTRFHPECFVCHHCGEALECVDFYPEPAKEREKRLDRIDRRFGGEEVEPPRGMSLADDSDDSLRFYCHLDFHEFFSPRCKSCKTPIEGEVIIACGAKWHVGHFFCAECGDPFDPSTPFVERDGYAWCVECHTKRVSARCKKCRRPVTDMVLEALGAEWHEECFSCTECNGKFEDGRYFLRGSSQDPVCPSCEERRLKA